MKKPDFFTFLLLVSLLFSLVPNTHSGWEQLTTPNNQSVLYGIYFADINTGISGVYKTTNSGQNWYQPTMIGGGYGNMTFPNQNTGYYTGVGTVYKTTNIGENWIQQNLPTGNNMYGIHFWDINTGYTCGENAKIVKTTNGGINWSLLTSPVSSSYYLSGIFFIDANTGFITGDETTNNTSVILKTINGGLNWSVQNFPALTGYHSIFFINSNTGIVLGNEAAKTTDGGNSWVSKPKPSGLFLSLYFSSSNTGYAVGYGSIIKTIDGGETWFEQTNPAGTLRSVYFINDDTGFACGNNGVVLKTTDGGGPPFGIQQISNEVPKDYSLSQNYPNPFNPFTNIEFRIPELGFVSIKIYNNLGKEIITLVNQHLKPGVYKVDWNALNYPSGIYFYKLITTKYTESKKMILVK